jgi:hypothetical protein
MEAVAVVNRRDARAAEGPHGRHYDRTPTHGYEATQEQAGPKRNGGGSGMETLFLKPTFLNAAIDVQSVCGIALSTVGPR